MRHYRKSFKYDLQCAKDILSTLQPPQQLLYLEHMQRTRRPLYRHLMLEFQKFQNQQLKQIGQLNQRQEHFKQQAKDIMDYMVRSCATLEQMTEYLNRIRGSTIEPYVREYLVNLALQQQQ